MAMDRATKEQLATAMNEDFKSSASVVVFHCQGLSVTESSELRKAARDAGASMRVTKNRIAKIALKGTDYEQISDLFTGQTAITYGDDPVAAAKVVAKYAKDNEKVIILGGALGQERLDEAGIKSLASMPSLDELRAKIVALIQTPATRLAQIASAPAGQVARVISAKSQQGE